MEPSSQSEPQPTDSSAESASKSTQPAGWFAESNQETNTTTTPTPPPEAPKPGHWRLSRRWLIAGAAAAIVAVVAIVLTATLTKHKSAPATKQAADSPIQLQNVGTEILKNLQSSAFLGDGKQTLAISAATIFKNDATFEKDAKFNGTFESFAPINALAGINVTGASSFEALSLRSNFTTAGDSTLQGNLDVAKQLTAHNGITVNGNSTLQGNLNVTGNISTQGSLGVGSLTVGDLTVNGHLVSGGTSPSATVGPGAGGGSARVSGNDTAGTVVIDASGSGTGTLATINFAKRFAGTPKVIITPVGTNSAKLEAYTGRTGSFFTIGANNPTTPGTEYAFDYLVIQ